ncbi:hypothetical protein AB0C84_23390 [Actinomadura sp. NPDC048955]|uniref:ABM domain-containing protein n=1 Tax=Actinomadura luteofluorescens TaxID=46163 RepID=A0A7Y9EFA6_9ACTN|nr:MULTISPECIES: hypothetical protein [Actinomadura]MCR3740951.1 hypothetical protein [Actinomadura glauciflava]NYD46456.1 hypothetical protein [Actinomadura luteofluorescens]
MGFVQIIDYRTDRQNELEGLFDEWAKASEGKRTATHELHTKDRQDASHYVDIVEFPSYEEAMRNSDLPETRRIAGEMEALCTDGPRFLNLEVVRDDQL